MKVLCRNRRRSDVSVGRCREYVQETAEDLVVGACYPVYGQASADGCLLYLIATHGPLGLRNPNWYPAEWFVVVENSIPKAWVFSYSRHHPGGGELAVWGYPELATSYEHWAGLQERDENALITFFRRSIEIDAELGEDDASRLGQE